MELFPASFPLAGHAYGHLEHPSLGPEVVQVSILRANTIGRIHNSKALGILPYFHLSLVIPVMISFRLCLELLSRSC